MTPKKIIIEAPCPFCDHGFEHEIHLSPLGQNFRCDNCKKEVSVFVAVLPETICISIKK